MEAPALRPTPPAHRLDEFPAGYSLAGCSPAAPASASPTEYEYAVMSSCRSRAFHRTAYCVLTVCVSPGGKRTYALTAEQPELLATLHRLRHEVAVANNAARIFFSTANQALTRKSEITKAHNEFMARSNERIAELAM